jgi:CRISPR-associated exonuclease Cas4
MDESDLIPISALQHFLYCPRQCALIHIEQLWAENRLTAEGRLLHERADQRRVEQRGDIRVVTAMPLASADLGLTGVADVVEFRRVNKEEIVRPVEYKRGRPKQHRADEVQLCAQAMCLEVMLGTAIASGDLYYGKTRRRRAVDFDNDLRALTLRTITDTRALLSSARTPTATYLPKRCDACSLIDLCQPKWLDRGAVKQWLRTALEN